MKSVSMADMAAVGMDIHSATIETCLQAMVRTTDLETISILCRNLETVARFPTKIRRLRTPDAEYQLL